MGNVGLFVAMVPFLVIEFGKEMKRDIPRLFSHLKKKFQRVVVTTDDNNDEYELTEMTIKEAHECWKQMDDIQKIEVMSDYLHNN